MRKLLNSTLLFIFIVLLLAFIYKVSFAPEAFRVSADDSGDVQVTTKTVDENGKVTISKKEIENIVKEYLVNNPEIMVTVAEELQRRKVEELSKKADDYIKDNIEDVADEGNPPVFGNEEGDITVVLFYDYNCSYCKQANIQINKVLKEDPNVEFVMRPIPILGGSSMYAARVALALSKISPERFNDIHNDMMQMKSINEESVKNMVKRYEIDYAILENEINSFSIQKLINNNLELAKNIGLKGAPSQIINGNFIAGMLESDKYHLIFKEIRKAQIPNKVIKDSAEDKPKADEGKRQEKQNKELEGKGDDNASSEDKKDTSAAGEAKKDTSDHKEDAKDDEGDKDDNAVKESN